MFPDKVYDVLKWFAQYIVPSSAALYFALADIWGLPFKEEVVGTIVAFDVFLGALLGISNLRYQQKDVMGVTSKYGMAVVGAETTISPSTYDILKWSVLTLMPSTATLYFTLSGFWGLPYGPQITATVSAVTAFLGIALGFNTRKVRKSIS